MAWNDGNGGSHLVVPRSFVPIPLIIPLFRPARRSITKTGLAHHHGPWTSHFILFTGLGFKYLSSFDWVSLIVDEMGFCQDKIEKPETN
ncbi:hypothetical protein KQX54_013447 [Cotesia glomerata]|uniref:Uncharacterized protein n=1 Tax=Cotesia glomerata TaxID=32391 RepID=A0AAV7J372_COTGL|nr:hypothetical protein KQX54_013447 [Cotesia glomerata]